jgi:hypothetical protein
MKKTPLLLLAAVFLSWADQSDENQIKLLGYSSYQGGHVLNGTYKYQNDIKNYWFQKIYANIGMFKKSNDWLSFTTSMEMVLRGSYKMGNTFPESQIFSPYLYIDQARGDILFIDSKIYKLNLTTGYFHFKYNEDVTNLGNTLFKSYCYPTAILQSEFDFPLSRLGGLDLYFSALDRKIFTDVLFTTSLHMYPMNDFSLTTIFGTEPFRGITFKAGVQLDRFLSANDKITTPKAVASKVNEAGEVTYYTYAGTKLMTCLNLDLKKLFFGEEYPSIFGKEEMKVYAEANVLGLKNYYYFYDTLKHRITSAFGIKVPTYKLLDIMALEFEYFGSRYPNSIDRPLNANNPFPDIQEADYLPEEWIDDDWKWSLYAKKDISDISLIFQIASDHLQLWSVRAVDQIYRDNLVKPSDMYYQFKIQYNL